MKRMCIASGMICVALGLSPAFAQPDRATPSQTPSDPTPGMNAAALNDTRSVGDATAAKQIVQVEHWAKQVEVQYSKLVAQLERIAVVAEEQGDTQMAQRAKDLLDKAQARYQKLMIAAQHRLDQLHATVYQSRGRTTVNDAAPRSVWQDGAGQPQGQRADGSGQPIDRQVDRGQINTQQQGQMQGVSREAYERQTVGNDSELEKALKETDAQP